MSERPPILVETLKNGAYVAGTPHSRALGLQFVHVEPKAGVLKIAWSEDLVGDQATGVIATGVVTAMLDHVCGLAVLASLTEPGFTATLDLRVDYLRPAEPRRDLYAEARCYRITRSVAFVRASAYEDTPDHPVATCQATFALTGRRRA
jgi:uncharacterized protein (TIGR00369 family)